MAQSEKDAKGPQKGQKGQPDESAREEAKHLAEEAVAEMKAGEKEDAKFVLDAARSLDKEAVDEVLKKQKKDPSLTLHFAPAEVGLQTVNLALARRWTNGLAQNDPPPPTRL